MKFLITNDDGFDGPGLAALYRGLKPLGDVRVVAPSVCHSAKGHAVNTHAPIRVERRDVAPFGSIQIVDASPADCVRLGLCAEDEESADYVIAGINTGANLGVDLFYSGTAAAAREAAILEVPAIALSRYMRPEFPVNWSALADHVTRVVKELTTEPHRLPAGQFWNVNFPAVDDDQHGDDFSIAPMGLMSHAVDFKPTETNGNTTVLKYHADFRGRGTTGKCDVSHVLDGRITATPVGLCNTADHSMLPSC